MIFQHGRNAHGCWRTVPPSSIPDGTILPISAETSWKQCGSLGRRFLERGLQRPPREDLPPFLGKERWWYYGDEPLLESYNHLTSVEARLVSDEPGKNWQVELVQLGIPDLSSKVCKQIPAVSSAHASGTMPLNVLSLRNWSSAGLGLGLTEPGHDVKSRLLSDWRWWGSPWISE